MPDDVPLVYGTAHLASLLYAGHSVGDLLDLLGPEPAVAPARAAWLMDRSCLCFLNFSPYQAAALQRQALALGAVYRVRGEAAGPRLLALCAPGDLMVNAPLDFITPHCGIRLDLAFACPERGLPPGLPAHDVAIVAASESAPAILRVLQPAFARWPVPVLNDPARIAPMSREWLPTALGHLPRVRTAPTWRLDRAALGTGWAGAFPILLRPVGSHAGHGLAKMDGPQDVARYLAEADGDSFYACSFVDYRGPCGWYAKYRIAFVAGAPFLCHMAASEHWMVHYLNAGMDADPVKRAAEQAAMAGFPTGFARRHAVALDAVAATIGLDYFSIDCAEAPCGRLLVFEADVAAIIHSMDPPALYPYKAAAMQRCYDAFGAMVRGCAGLRRDVASAAVTGWNAQASTPTSAW
jgi:hypothetical protein